jgi:hypothetical protein
VALNPDCWDLSRILTPVNFFLSSGLTSQYAWT